MHKIKTILYYDGQCAVCAREMQNLNRIKDEHLLLLDIHEQGFPSDIKSSMLDKLHVYTHNGEMLLGFKANIKAWQHTPYKSFVTLFSLPPLCWLGEFAYALWLRYYKFNKVKCTVESC